MLLYQKYHDNNGKLYLYDDQIVMITAQLENEIGSKIIDKSTGDNQDISEFIRLYDLLGFLETIGWLVEECELSISEVNSVFGHSIKFYYRIFSPLIKRKRELHCDPTLYIHFENLYNSILNKKVN